MILMNPSITDGTPIGEWLGRQPSGLRSLLERAYLIAELNRVLPTWSDDPWVTQIRVANVRDGTLVVHAGSAAVMVQLRYRGPSLLAWCNDRFRFDCSKIEAKVRPGPGL